MAVVLVEIIGKEVTFDNLTVGYRHPPFHSESVFEPLVPPLLVTLFKT